MDQPSDMMKKFLIIFILGVLIIKSAGGAGFFEARSHKGKGYYVKIPDGWKKLKQREDAVYPQGVEVVTFVPKQTDVSKEPARTYIMIYTKKLTTPIWIEDEFPAILDSLRKAGFEVKDDGQILLGEEISFWVVYHDKKESALVLEFYVVTDNNTFYKMQYSSLPNEFNTYRPSFEKLRESFKFRFSLF